MIIALRLDTPMPLRMYLQNALLSLRLQVTLCKSDSNFLFRISMPPQVGYIVSRDGFSRFGIHLGSLEWVFTY